MTENATPERELLLSRLREFFREVENLAIENRVCFDVILERCALAKPTLDEMVKRAQEDPQTREEIHQQYTDMWAALEKSANDAFAEEQLNRPLPPGEPN